MCANFENLEQEIIDLEVGGIDILYRDVTIRTFVANFSMLLQDIESICKTTTRP